MSTKPHYWQGYSDALKAMRGWITGMDFKYTAIYKVNLLQYIDQNMADALPFCENDNAFFLAVGQGSHGAVALGTMGELTVDEYKRVLTMVTACEPDEPSEAEPALAPAVQDEEQSIAEEKSE